MKIFLYGFLLFVLAALSIAVFTDIPLPYFDSDNSHSSPSEGVIQDERYGTTSMIAQHPDTKEESTNHPQSDQGGAEESKQLPLAGSVQRIEWKDLIPQEHRTEDPLAALSQEEQEEAEWIIYLRMNLTKKITEREQEFYDEMAAALPKLKEKGIDVDKIIAERQVRTTSLNEELNKKRVQLSGYLLPLDMLGKKIREFLLVPFVGACIHVPPPPPNQIVHAISEKPITFTMNDLFKPVTITGTLMAQSASKELFLVDGRSDVDIGYVMEVETVERYYEPPQPTGLDGNPL